MPFDATLGFPERFLGVHKALHDLRDHTPSLGCVNQYRLCLCHSLVHGSFAFQIASVRVRCSSDKALSCSFKVSGLPGDTWLLTLGFCQRTSLFSYQPALSMTAVSRVAWAPTLVLASVISRERVNTGKQLYRTLLLDVPQGRHTLLSTANNWVAVMSCDNSSSRSCDLP